VNILRPILIPELMLYLFIFLPAFIILVIFVLIIIKSPPQAKTFIKAKFLKRSTLVLSGEDGSLDIVAPKINKTGHLEVSKGEVYQPLKGTNPVVSDRFFWRKTGIPVFVSAGRKAVYTSPRLLTAIETVEREKNIPEHIKKWAEQTKIPITQLVQKDGKDVAETKMEKLFCMNPQKLKDYVGEAVDVDAETLLYDQAYQEGYEAAGKPPKIFYVIIGCAFAAVMLLMAFLALGLF